MTRKLHRPRSPSCSPFYRLHWLFQLLSSRTGQFSFQGYTKRPSSSYPLNDLHLFLGSLDIEKLRGAGHKVKIKYHAKFIAETCGAEKPSHQKGHRFLFQFWDNSHQPCIVLIYKFHHYLFIVPVSKRLPNTMVIGEPRHQF